MNIHELIQKEIYNFVKRNGCKAKYIVLSHYTYLILQNNVHDFYKIILSNINGDYIEQYCGLTIVKIDIKDRNYIEIGY